MATKSFYEDFDLSTSEAVANLEGAIEDADRRGPLALGSTVGVTEDRRLLDRGISRFL